MKGLELANPETDEMRDCTRPWGWENEEWLLVGVRILLGGNESVLKLIMVVAAHFVNILNCILSVGELYGVWINLKNAV